MKKLKIFFVILLLLGCKNTFSQKVGTTSLQFLKVLPTARGTAMADAFTATVWGVDALFWNPGGLAGVENFEISSTMILWLMETKQSYIGFAMPIGNMGVLGAQFQYVDYGIFEETRVDQLQFIGSGADIHYNPGLTGRTFSPKAYSFGLSYAKLLTQNFSTGLTIKYIHESLYDQTTVTIMNPNGGSEEYKTYTNGLLFDFGMNYNTYFRSIKIGVAVQNFGSSIKYGSQAYPAPLAFRLGTSFNLFGQDALFLQNEDNRLTLAYDIFQPNDYAQQMHFGMEYSFMEMFSIRTGYKMKYDNEKFSFGCGINQDISNFNLMVDYSFASMGELLGSVHRISLGVKIR
jgi:hypothetical protein